MIRIEEGRRFIDRTITLGKRQAIVAVEYALIGMKEGGIGKCVLVPIWRIETKEFRI